MFPYHFYKFFHIAGLSLLVAGLFLIVAHFYQNPNPDKSLRKTGFLLHGAGLLLVLVSGFGMLARLGPAAAGLPQWVLVKIGIWISLGVIVAFIKRKAEHQRLWTSLIIGLLLAAFYVAIFKL
jgi:hypothetical protein